MKNKIQLAIIVFLLGIAAPGFGQSIELTPYGGWMFGGKFRAYEGEVKIGDNPNYGGILGIRNGNTILELQYFRMYSEASLRVYGSFVGSELFEITSEYYHIGATQLAPLSDVVEGFGSLSLGLTRYDPKTQVPVLGFIPGDEWFFSAMFGAGLRVNVSERVGLRFQGRLMAPMRFSGLGLFCGTGSGCSVGAGSYAAIIQGDFSGGLILKLN